MSWIRTNHRQIGSLSGQCNQPVVDNSRPIDMDERCSTRVEPSFSKYSFFRTAGRRRAKGEIDPYKVALPGVPITSGCSHVPSSEDLVHVDHPAVPPCDLQDAQEHSDVSSLSSYDTSSASEPRTSPFVTLPRPTMVTSELKRSITVTSEPVRFCERTRPSEPEAVRPATPAAEPSVEIEIHPGVYGRLRGAEETRRAIANDFFLPCECVSCTQTIFHIQDADFVLCPDCRTLQPVGASPTGCSHGTGGVGLGFKMAELLDMQQQILKER